MAKRVDGKDWCTYFPDYVPSLFRWKWRVYIGDLCKMHDELYAEHHNKPVADLLFFINILERGLPLVGVLAYAGVSTFGWYFYLRTRGK